MLEKKIFEIIYIDDLFIKVRVFENRFVNQIKNEKTEKTFEKSRFVYKHSIIQRNKRFSRRPLLFNESINDLLSHYL